MLIIDDPANNDITNINDINDNTTITDPAPIKVITSLGYTNLYIRLARLKAIQKECLRLATADMKDIATGVGICNQLKIAGKNSSIIAVIATYWPLHSGRYDYPVPSAEGYSPYDCYCTYQAEGISLWDASTEYGKLRRELCAFISHYILEILPEIEAAIEAGKTYTLSYNSSIEVI